jgi:putative endonuclease
MSEFVNYILLSPSTGKTYVGFSSDLINRMKSHNIFDRRGYASRYRPWVVIHVEFFDNKSDAMKREKWYKSGVGRSNIKNIILK